jgi:hypothetical protein
MRFSPSPLGGLFSETVFSYFRRPPHDRRLVYYKARYEWEIFPHLTSPCLLLSALEVLVGAAYGSTSLSAALFPCEDRRQSVALPRPIALAFRFIRAAERLSSCGFD